VRVLLVHNFYQFPGGEDQVFAAEGALLESRGHAVFRYTRSNDELAALGPLARARATIWNGAARAEVAALVRRERIEVVHVHNTFPLISPAVYAAARDGGAAVVQTLHNFRTLCVKAQLLRDGKVCEDCVGRAVPWPGVVHRCYRDSLVASGAAATMLTVHRAAGTWRRAVDRYVALTGFARDRFVAGGLPAARIAVKPNFLDAPAPAPGAAGADARRGGLFVGRLSPEKGIGVLAGALARVPVPVRIAGEGPVALAASAHAALLGRIDSAAVAREMAAAAFLVVPSVWYEGFPMVIVEAFARGLPVVASRIGSLAEIVEDGVTGLLAAPGDAADLAAKLRWAHDHPEAMAAMGRAARARYEALYTPERNYAMLMEIYEAARAQAAAGDASTVR